MSRWCLDRSAAAKLVVGEPESEALADDLRRHRPALVSCLLLETELRRIAARATRALGMDTFAPV